MCLSPESMFLDLVIFVNVPHSRNQLPDDIVSSSSLLVYNQLINYVPTVGPY